MSYNISMEDFGEIITIDKQTNKRKNQVSKKDEVFTSNFEEMILSKDLSLIKWELETNKDLQVFGDYKNDCICIRLSLNGNFSQYEQNSNTHVNLCKNDVSIISIKEINGKEVYKKNIKNQVLDIYLSKNFFKKFLPETSLTLFENINENDFYKVLKSKKSFHQSISCANNIFNSPFEKEINELFIHGLTLELLSYELKGLFINKKENNKQIKFNDYDINALEKAKLILTQNLETPPSINELAKIIKLNEFKLKYGFKYFFNTTPYALLLDKRMEKAHEMLVSSEYNINEISSLVGYKQASNFSKAFVKKYGILPKELMKNRTYYY